MVNPPFNVFWWIMYFQRKFVLFEDFISQPIRNCLWRCFIPLILILRGCSWRRVPCWNSWYISEEWKRSRAYERRWSCFFYGGCCQLRDVAKSRQWPWKCIVFLAAKAMSQLSWNQRWTYRIRKWMRGKRSTLILDIAVASSSTCASPCGVVDLILPW